jgi:hypothetical protein
MHAPDGLDWRARRARLLYEHGRRATRADDGWVRLALSFLRGPRRRGPRLEAARAAWQVHEEGGPRRWVLEAGALAGEDDEQLSRRCGLPAAAVAAYLPLFWDVGGCAGARGYLAQRALPRRACLGVDPRDTAGLLRLAAYAGGPLALDAVARLLLGPPAGGLEGEVPGPQGLAEICEGCLCRVWLLAQTMPVHACDLEAVLTLEGLADEAARLLAAVEASPEAPAPEPAAALAERLRSLDEMIAAIELAARAPAA